MFARQLGSDLFRYCKLFGVCIFLIGLLLVACSENEGIAAVSSPSATPTLQLPTAMPTTAVTPMSVLPSATPTPMATAMLTTTPSSTPMPTITPTPTLDPFFTFVETTPQAVEGGSVKVEIFPSEDYIDLLLRITRDNIVIQESSVDLVIFNDEDRFPDGDYPPILGVGIETVRDLDLDGEPEIVLDTITQGTNCCTSVVVLFFDIDGQQYHRTNSITRHWRFSPRLIDIDQGGRPEFVTRNEEFNYLVGGDSFTSVVSPLHILRYENRAIVDVTYQYPELVEQDAALWFAAVQGEVAELSELYREITLEDPEFWVTGVRGIEFFALKSYMADMITLGRGYEGCQNVQAFFESDYERWSGVFESYGDNICPNFMAEVEAAMAGRVEDG